MENTDLNVMYQEHAKQVYGFLYKMCQDADLSEDLMQDTFLKAMEHIDSYDGKCKLTTWLCQIAKYVFYQSLDKNRRRKEVPFDEAVETAMQEETENSVVGAESKLHIYRTIQSLPSPMRDVVMLRLTGELSFKEIGEVLSQSENWARVTFYRAKQILGKELKER